MILRVVALVATLWSLGFALFAATLPRPAPADARTDAIVVLTGGAGRIDRGLALMERGAAERMLISGVGIAVRPRELAAQYDAPRAIFDCCIDLGDRAVDTRSNADEVARWVAQRDYRSVRLVTSDWHMRRARYELTRALPAEVGLSTDAVRTSPGLGVLVNEYNKYLLRRAAAPFGL